ncbi:MAG: four helix bundle protein [Phycisphaerales bacterium JB037]
MNEDIRSYRDLAAWQNARDLAIAVYRMTTAFPADERFGLVTQMRRSAVSIAANIAEGYGRGRALDYARFLRMARGSLFELESHAEIAAALGLLDSESRNAVQERIDLAARPLSGLLRSVESKADQQ